MEDDIYGLEVDLDIDLFKLEIMSARGKWTRMENSECVRALPFLQEAVGFRMDEDFVRKVQKIVGRKACRHFADIILECCSAAKEAANIILMEAQKKDTNNIKIDELFGKSLAGGHKKKASFSDRSKNPGPAGETDGDMIIDLHVHTLPASPCSTISIEKIIDEAKGIGLDGICLTDHNYVWTPDKVEELRQKHGFLILRGNEITTEQGDVLVFGLEEDIKGVIKLEELRTKVLKCDGFMIVAHPFRGFLTFGIGYLGLTREKAMERPVFKLVDAIEVLNSKVSVDENGFAAQVAEGLKLPVTGGSDAHGPGEVGLYATRFPCRIQNEQDLIKAFKKGTFTPVTFRNK
jgi:predicted metal-dependent phosphoesterase TrpH